MKKIILDTSVIAKWFTREKGSAEAEKFLTSLQSQKVQILLPELVKYELANALLKGKKFSYSKAKEVLTVFYKLPLIFISGDFQLALLTYRLASKLNITYYDACFLALAQREKAMLITANPKHQKKLKNIKIKQMAA